MPAIKYPGDTFKVEFKFKWTGPQTDVIFDVMLGAQGFSPGDFNFNVSDAPPNGLAWSVPKTIPAGTGVQQTITLPALIIPTTVVNFKNYDARGRIMRVSDLKELAKDQDTGVVEIIDVKVEGLDCVYDGIHGAG